MPKRSKNWRGSKHGKNEMCRADRDAGLDADRDADRDAQAQLRVELADRDTRAAEETLADGEEGEINARELIRIWSDLHQEIPEQDQNEEDWNKCPQNALDQPFYKPIRVAEILVRDQYYIDGQGFHLSTDAEPSNYCRHSIPMDMEEGAQKVEISGSVEPYTYPLCREKVTNPNLETHNLESMVTVCTACRSRGIEFDNMFLIYLSSAIWQKNKTTTKEDWKKLLYCQVCRAVPKFEVQSDFLSPEPDKEEVVNAEEVKRKALTKNAQAETMLAIVAKKRAVWPICQLKVDPKTLTTSKQANGAEQLFAVVRSLAIDPDVKMYLTLAGCKEPKRKKLIRTDQMLVESRVDPTASLIQGSQSQGPQPLGQPTPEDETNIFNRNEYLAGDENEDAIDGPKVFTVDNDNKTEIRDDADTFTAKTKN